MAFAACPMGMTALAVPRTTAEPSAAVVLAGRGTTASPVLVGGEGEVGGAARGGGGGGGGAASLAVRGGRGGECGGAAARGAGAGGDVGAGAAVKAPPQQARPRHAGAGERHLLANRGTAGGAGDGGR